MKTLHLTKKFWIVLFTLSLMTLVFVYYFMIYTPTRERKLIDEKYRALASLGDNILEKRKDFTNTAGNNARTIMRLLNNTSTRTEDKRITNYFSPYEKVKFHLSVDDKHFTRSIDAVQHTISASGSSRKDSVAFTISIPENDQEVGYYRVDSMCFVISSAAFVEPLIKGIDLDEFFLIRSAAGESSIIYQTLHNEIRLDNIDSLIATSQGLKNSKIKEVFIHDDSYKLFYSRVQFDKNTDWILCSLVKSQHYRSHVRKVDTIILLFSSLILLVIILGMPVIKLRVMSALERVSMSNVFFMGLSFVTGPALFLLISLSCYQYWGYPNQELNDHLKKLSTTIHDHFKKETTAMYNQLLASDVQKRAGSIKWQTISRTTSVGLPSQKIKKNIFSDTTLYTAGGKKPFNIYPLFNEILWANKDGHILNFITNRDSEIFEELPNLKTREYFKNANERNLWMLPGDSKRGWTFQTYRSFLNASHEASMAIPVSNSAATVLAMPTKLRSVMDPVLPPGYGFCIVDESGKAWFHSDATRAMQENFLDEIEDASLQAAIEQRVDFSTRLEYGGKLHNVYIRPMDNIPLYLITFYDLDYFKAPVMLTSSHAFILMIIMFVLMSIHLILLYACTIRYSRLKIKTFFLYWLRPINNSMFQSYYRIGIVVMLALVVFILVLFVFYRTYSVSFVVILMPLYLFTFVYMLFKRQSENDKSFHVRVDSFVVSTLLFLFLLNLLAAHYLSDWLFNICLQVIVILILVGGLFVAARAVRKPEKIVVSADRRNTGQVLSRLFEKWKLADTNSLYIGFLFIWLFLVSVLPVFYLYKVAHYQEHSNWLRVLQKQAAESHDAYTHKIKSEEGFLPIEFERIERYGNYVSSTGEFRILKKYKEDNSINNSVELLRIIKPPYDYLTRKARTIIYGKALDKQWFSSIQPDTVQLSYRRLRGGSHSDEYETLVASVKSFSFFSGIYAEIFWLFCMACGLIIFHVLRFSLRYTYGMDLLPVSNAVQLDGATFSNHLKKVKRIFFVGLPYSGKSSLLEKHVTPSCTVDFSRVDPALDLTCETVLCKNFEWDLDSHETNVKKLQRIQKMIENHHRYVVISSTVDPLYIIEFYEQMEEDARKVTNDDANKSDRLIYRQQIKQWRDILGHFTLIYHPLGPLAKVTRNDLKNELEHGNYLPRLEKEFIPEDDHMEDKILKIEALSITYYNSIWNSLSEREKLQLYDLARDKFVNLRQADVMRRLINKGLVHVNDSLSLFNSSFQNFVLDVIKEDEALIRDEETRTKGTWNTVQLVLLLVAFGIVAFITLVQQNLLQNFNALITAIGGVVALLIRFGGLFNFGSKPKE